MEEPGPPFEGERGLDWEVGAAGLEDGEDRDYQVERAFEADRDSSLGTDAEGLEVVGEAIRLLGELAIAYLFSFADQCRRLAEALERSVEEDWEGGWLALEPWADRPG